MHNIEHLLGIKFPHLFKSFTAYNRKQSPLHVVSYTLTLKIKSI
jgi:hypothetical protein